MPSALWMVVMVFCWWWQTCPVHHARRMVSWAAGEAPFQLSNGSHGIPRLLGGSVSGDDCDNDGGDIGGGGGGLMMKLSNWEGDIRKHILLEAFNKNDKYTSILVHQITQTEASNILSCITRTYIRYPGCCFISLGFPPSRTRNRILRCKSTSHPHTWLRGTSQGSTRKTLYFLTKLNFQQWCAHIRKQARPPSKIPDPSKAVLFMPPFGSFLICYKCCIFDLS